MRKLVAGAITLFVTTMLSTGMAFAASPVPVYRLYNPLIHQHLQTVDAVENAVLTSDGWVGETPTFQAIPASSGICSSGTEPVYRLYNSVDKDHLLTPDTNEVIFWTSAHITSWRNEGVAFCAYGTQVSGTKPVYRLDRPDGQEHFLTADQNEVNVLTSRGWSQEVNGNGGITFYAN